MAHGIVDTLRGRIFLLLLVVAAAGLSSGYFARELIVADFQQYMEGKLEDRTYLVLAKLEGSYEKHGGWSAEPLADEVVWALMMGLRTSISDRQGQVVMDVNRAIEGLSPAVRDKLSALASLPEETPEPRENVYPLFSRGEEIGQLVVACTHPHKELLFIGRTNRLLLFALAGTGLVALALSFLFSRRIVRPVAALTAAARAVREGDAPPAVPVKGGVELRELAQTFNTMAEFLHVQDSLRKRLMANAAHELRTPMAAVRVQIEAMADGILPADAGHLKAVMGELDRFRLLIDGLEELSQAEASFLNLKKDDVDLATFLGHHLERFRLLTAESGLRFELRCPPGLRVHADPERLSQIVVNLLSNACKATAAGGAVTVAAEAGTKNVTLSVADTGVGIEENQQPFIFERFHRGFAQGLGLGLAIVKELVAAHAGTITVESEVGRGTCFRIVLPDQSS